MKNEEHPVITEIKKLSEVVKEILTDKPRLRDDDHKLVATIWYKQIPDPKKVDSTESSTDDLLNKK